MLGKRRSDLEEQETHNNGEPLWYKLQPGEYMKSLAQGGWMCCSPPNASCPEGAHGNLTRHDVVEHEDGTITVTPSILITGGGSWHGYLTRGVWSEV